ncbi:MAG: TRAM domain-containing protein, partial [Bacilli bacterium]|nr:TRAM domain-containing protein [Bacilli bacterium]
DNIMPCIHLPVQSGSTTMLRRMGRRYTREQYLDLVRRIREKIPGCALTTDIIVGFPNETEEEFEDTLTLCEEVKYDAAFTFLYSPRKGTPAAALKDDVPDEVKHERFNRLLKVVEAGVMSHSSQMVGKTYKVLVDGPSKKNESVLSGYTESNKLVNFEGPAYLKGQIVDVEIVEDHAFSMIGKLTKDPLIILAEKAAESLKEEPEAIAFLEAKKAVEESPSLIELRGQIEKAQKAMVQKAADSDGEAYEKAKNEYLSLMNSYKKDPVVLNYEARKDDLEELLRIVKGTLS